MRDYLENTKKYIRRVINNKYDKSKGLSIHHTNKSTSLGDLGLHLERRRSFFSRCRQKQVCIYLLNLFISCPLNNNNNLDFQTIRIKTNPFHFLKDPIFLYPSSTRRLIYVSYTFLINKYAYTCLSLISRVFFLKKK